MKRNALPLLLTILGLWLLSGCFKTPVLEHRENSGIDFRDVVGDALESADSAGGGHAAQIIARLGQPRFETVDRTAIGYGYTTVRAVWVYPLCFGTSPGSDRFYVIRFTFDHNDVLVNWKTSHQDGEHDFFIDNTTHWDRDAAGELGLEMRSTHESSERPLSPRRGRVIRIELFRPAEAFIRETSRFSRGG